MTEKKRKKDLQQLRVEPSVKRGIDAEAVRLDVFSYEVVAKAWDSYGRELAAQQREKTHSTSPNLPTHEGSLEVFTGVTDAERGLLEVSPEAREWLDLAVRALRIRDPQWREMLQNIKKQLQQVANIADIEPEQEDGGGFSGGKRDQGTPRAGGDRKKPGGTTGRGGRKAG